jgi:glycosyltransferase involved in cell wall biosynthesis
MLTVWQLDPAQTTAYYNAALCNALARAGCKVEYLTSHYLYDEHLPLSGEIRVDYAYKLIVNPALLRRSRWLRRAVRAATYLAGHWSIARRAAQSPPDILHMQWSRWTLLDRWLIERFHRLKIPVVYTVHDVVPLFSSHAQQAYEQIYTRVDRLIVHTQSNAEAFQREFPQVCPDKIRVIPLISAPNSSTPADASRADARRRLGIPDDARAILFFGTIRAYKGLSNLVEAFQIAAQSEPNLWLIVAGRPESARDAQPLRRLEGHQNVVLNTTFIPYESMWQYFLAADAAVFPYDHIYQSAALIDAMGFGCPVIVTDVGGLAETIDGNGWVVPKGDVPGLAQTIVDAVSDSARLKQMSERSRELYKLTNANEAVTEQTLRVYWECRA